MTTLRPRPHKRSAPPMPAELEALLKALPSIRWDDHVEPMGWLCAFCPPFAGRTAVVADYSAVLAVFAAHGYEPHIYARGAGFDASSRDIYARWVIGQALYALSTGTASGLCQDFAVEWAMAFHEGVTPAEPREVV